MVDKVTPLSISLYNIYGKTEQGEPYVEVPLLGFVLDPGKSVTVPVRFANLGKAVTAVSFSVQAEPLDPLTTARLEVRAQMNADTGMIRWGRVTALRWTGSRRRSPMSQAVRTSLSPLALLR